MHSLIRAHTQFVDDEADDDDSELSSELYECMRSYVECLDAERRLTCMKSYNDCSLEAMRRSRNRNENNNNNKGNSRNKNRNPKPRPVPGIISRVESGSSSGAVSTVPNPSVRPALGDGENFVRGLPFSTYAVRGRGGVNDMANFCIQQD